MKIELILTDEMQQEIAERLRDTIFSLVKKGAPRAKIADIPSVEELIKHPGWVQFLRTKAEEAWTDFICDDLVDYIGSHRSGASIQFAAQIEQARNLALERQSKSIKISPKDHEAAKKLLSDAGIPFK